MRQPYVYTTPVGNLVSVDLPGSLQALVGDGPPEPADVWRILHDEPDGLARLLDVLTRRLPFDLVLVIEQGDELVLQRTGPAPKDGAASWRR